MTYREFIRVLTSAGFALDRQRGSHRVFKGHVGGAPKLVVVAGHGDNEDIPPGTLAAMIRQSGLDKSAFR